MSLTFQPFLDQHQSLTKFQSMFKIKSHQLCCMNTLVLLLANYLTFASVLSNLNVSDYLSYSKTCQCKECKFCYETHGHVITGDLRLIENVKLWELIANGPKYREPHYNVQLESYRYNVFLIHLCLCKTLVQEERNTSQISL